MKSHSETSFEDNKCFPFSLVKTEIFFHIAPYYANNIESGIKQQLLTKYLLKYSDLFCGVPILFRKIEFDQGTCEIFHENPFLHVRATVEFVVFTPKTGDTLKMTVSKQSEGHIAGLVFGIFNASIRDESLLAAEFSTWDAESGAWIDSQTNTPIGAGTEIAFEVDWVKHGNEVLVICGKNPQSGVY